MNIGKLASLTGLSSKAIRFYESEGIIESPQRQANGYRDYPQSAVAELNFLRQARQFGFSLDECRQLMTLWHNPKRRSAEVHQLVTERQHQVEQQIAELQEMSSLLNDLLNRCSANESSKCAIIDSLAGKKA
ncbi:Cu(I)-responsive transcriptional regulator [Porticoccaceae bacterium LTM1]|nr:Cu(I)-responsive transcriptional regulator [Porticoccaceae bacterium LTM1]